MVIEDVVPALAAIRRPPAVLVVEDEPRLRELLVDVATDMGFAAIAARSAEEASRLFDADPADVVLLDLQLPGMNGMDLFEDLRRRRPQTQVVVVTGFGDLAAAQRAIRLGVVEFLTKPFHLNEVEAALDRARRRLPAGVDEPATGAPAAADGPVTLAESERQLILAALRRHDGNRTAAAAELGISRRKLHYWLAENPTDG